MKSLVFATLILTSANSFAAGPEGCYEMTSRNGQRKFQFELKSVLKDSVGTVFDVRVRMNGTEVQHQHASFVFRNYGNGECLMKLPTVKFSATDYFDAELSLHRRDGTHQTPAQCQAADFDSSESGRLQLYIGTFTGWGPAWNDNAEKGFQFPSTCGS